MAIFDYKNYLNVDQDTYDSWSGFITELENNAVITAKRLLPGIDTTTANEELFNYAKEVVFIGIYGDTLTPALLQFHKERLAESEEFFRWWA